MVGFSVGFYQNSFLLKPFFSEKIGFFPPMLTQVRPNIQSSGCVLVRNLVVNFKLRSKVLCFKLFGCINRTTN